MNIARLYPEQQQSPWLDNLRRDALVDGSLQSAIDSGIRGLTSNPTIFQKAITSSSLYDQQFRKSLDDGRTVEEAYWDLVVTDITGACDLFAPLHESSDGRDGFVSVEVSPSLCHDAEGTIAAARELATRVSRPNVMIKIPATDAGLEAIATVIGDGISVNVTLIFGVPRYLQVVAAHQRGMETLAKRDQERLPHVASVASFFISRVDNAIDPLIAETGLPLGRTAIAQAKIAYREFCQHLSSSAWASVANRGAQAQRPLWASTSTKNPTFSPTLYVDELIGPNTVNTLPDATLEAFDRSGTVARTIDIGYADAEHHLLRVAESGINVDEIARQLETDGLKSFQASFDDLLAALASKATTR